MGLSLLIALVASASALAEGGANVSIVIGSPDAGGVPSITRTIMPDEGWETFTIQEAELIAPRGFKVNNPAGLETCSVDPNVDESFEKGANPPQCPPGSVIGSATADSPIVANPMRGTIYLLDSDRDNEPVRIGVYVPARNGPMTVHNRLYADVTIEGDVGQERIKVKFNASRFHGGPRWNSLLLVPVRQSVLTLYGEGDVHQGYDDNLNDNVASTDPNDGNRTNALIRLPASCGVYSWDAKLKIANQWFVQPAGPITVNVNRNCNAPVRDRGIFGLGNYYNYELFDPVVGMEVEGGVQPDVTYLLKDHTMDLSFLGRGFGQYDKKHKANNTAAGLQSMRDANLALSVSSSGGFEVDLSRAPAGARLGRTTMAVYAFGRRHEIEGEVRRTRNGAQLVFTENVPQMIKDAAGGSRVVIDGIFSTRRSGNIVGHYLTFNALPTAYEVRELSLTFEGASGVTNKKCGQAGRPPLMAAADFTSDRPPLRGWDVTVAPCVLQQSKAAISTKTSSQKAAIGNNELDSKLLGLIPVEGQKLATRFSIPNLAKLPKKTDGNY